MSFFQKAKWNDGKSERQKIKEFLFIKNGNIWEENWKNPKASSMNQICLKKINFITYSTNIIVISWLCKLWVLRPNKDEKCIHCCNSYIHPYNFFGNFTSSQAETKAVGTQRTEKMCTSKSWEIGDERGQKKGKGIKFNIPLMKAYLDSEKKGKKGLQKKTEKRERKELNLKRKLNYSNFFHLNAGVKVENANTFGGEGSKKKDKIEWKNERKNLLGSMWYSQSLYEVILQICKHHLEHWFDDG